MEQEGYKLKDFLPMTWPKNDFELKAIYLGNFEKWEQRKQVEIITMNLGWKHYNVEGTYVDWDKVDCPFEPVRDWQKFMKRGFGRTCFQASKDVRDGLITREKALELIEQYDGKRPFILDSFLKEVKMTEEEFNEITKKHIVKKEENSNKIVSIIQARMNSERFPNKVLEKIDGEPMISFVLNQVNKSKLIDKIVVASTLNPKDKLLIEKIKDYGYDTFAGSEDDVLDRYYQAAKKFGAKIIVRITADCPLIDPQIIDKVIKKFQETDCDYCSNIQPPTFPDGLDVEVFSFEALERAWKEAKLISEREHVTHYLWKNKDKFKISNLENGEDLSKMRFTVDEIEDIVLINKIVRKIDKRPIHLEDITKVIKINPDLLEINKQYKRNEGWERSFEADKKMNDCGGTVI
jgi:spore coat polysaccharide biosynthesis protein SpsF (cytidylyltransferase family)